MVGVDVSVLNLDQIADHRVCRGQLLVQQAKHNVDYFFAKILESVQFLHLDLVHDSSQLFVDKLHALKTGRLQSVDLLLAQHFKCNLGHEKIGP